MLSPSRPTQTIATCGLPSALIVTKCARCPEVSAVRAVSVSTSVRYVAVASPPPFESLDFIYTPTADVDATADWYVEMLGARLDFKVRAMGTTVAALSIASTGPRVLLAGHLHTPGPILVYRVADYHATLTKLAAAGLSAREELEIPHGPCAVFDAVGGQAFAIYELVRPEAATYFEGRVDP